MSEKFDFYCEVAIPKKEEIKTEYESDTVLAFHHTKPSYSTHIVIVPKKHISDLVSLEEKDLLWEIKEVATLLTKKHDLEQEGVRLITNLGKFQDTPHLHFHFLSGNKV